MKKIISLAIMAIMAVMICACGGNNSSNDVGVDYSTVQEEMGNFMCENAYSVYDGWIYTMSFPEGGGQGILVKMRMDGSEYTVMTSKGAPTYIAVDGEFVYSILWNGDTCKAYRCRLGGNELKQITKDDVVFLQVTDEYLYYNKYNPAEGRTLGYYRCAKDGSDEELVYDKEIYYSYIIDKYVYYQDDKDGETIHAYNLETKEDVQITDEYSYGFVTDGEYLYYVSNDKSVLENDYVGCITKLNLETTEKSVLYDGAATSDIIVKNESIYFVNANDENRIYSVGKDGSGIKLISQDTNCMRLATFGDNLLYTDFDSNFEFIDGVYICNLDGSDKIRVSHHD